MPLDVKRIKAAIRAAEIEALEQTAQQIAVDAIGRAPSRHLLPGRRGTTRKVRLSPAVAALPGARRGGLTGYIKKKRRGRNRPGPLEITRYNASKPEFRFFLNSLSSRGRYEVKRALRGESVNLAGGLGVRVGGNLKSHIAADKNAVEDGSKVSISVRAFPKNTSGKGYARYVEFPTRHNRAQPFLLPALKDGRGYLKTQMRKALKEALEDLRKG